MNRVTLIGRVVADPVLRTTADGKTKIASYRLAVKRKYGSETDFFDVKAFNQQADFAVNYLCKGLLIGVDGRLEVNAWKGKDGKERRDVLIVAENHTFCEGRKEKPAEPIATQEDFFEETDEDVPF